MEVDEQETFNLSVEGTECYFAGALAVLAHNITASRLAWLQRPGFRNYTLVDANGTVYYSGMFGPNTTPAEVRARHAANHDRFNPSKSENIDGKNVGGDDMVIEPGTREYGEARILENQLAVEHETINRSKPETYRCNRQQPLADAKVQEYGEYLRFKETCG